MPFSYELSKRHKALMHRSDATTQEAKELQALHDEGETEKYAQRLAEFKKGGHQFRVTANKVYEIYNEPGLFCDVSIKFQVKGNVITWAFIGPIDETYQEFRDILYGTAADAHQHVEFGCERYYRGTNAYHLKKMHSNTGEFNYNHNHYRRKDGLDMTPKEVEEHLMAFLKQPHGKLFFPHPDEAKHIVEQFKRYWRDWNSTGPDRPVSLAEQYRTEESQRMDREDAQEEQSNIHTESPCRLDVGTVSPEQAAIMKMMRMRGLGGEFANLRQPRYSDLKKILGIVEKGDRVSLALLDDKKTQQGKKEVGAGNFLFRTVPNPSPAPSEASSGSPVPGDLLSPATPGTGPSVSPPLGDLVSPASTNSNRSGISVLSLAFTKSGP